MRAADAEIQARLAAERLAQERAAPREITAFGFPTNARENQPRQAPAAAREAEETEAEEATSRFNHLEL